MSDSFKAFTFRCVLDCHNGEQHHRLTDFDVTVEAFSETEARDMLGSIAHEMVHDDGSATLDWPLEYLDVYHAELTVTV